MTKQTFKDKSTLLDIKRLEHIDRQNLKQVRRVIREVRKENNQKQSLK